jgi:hypothetical protein
MPCSHCGSTRTRSNGLREGRRYFYCNACHRSSFGAKQNPETLLAPEANANELPTEQRRTVTIALRLVDVETLGEMYQEANGPAHFPNVEAYASELMDNFIAAHRLAKISVNVNAPKNRDESKQRRQRNGDYHNLRTAAALALRK